MKILLLGKNGQVGWELQRALVPLGEVIALDRLGEEGLCGDLTDLNGLAATVRRVAPQIIVNAAAYTAVDKAEKPETAFRINAEAPGVLAREAAVLGAWLVHYSTDYVFDGSGNQPKDENTAVGPLSVYGSSKRSGEAAALAASAKTVVFRTSWVYAERGNNFAKTMLRLAQEREQLNVVDDQIGAPTGADLIADVTAHAIRLLMSNDSHALAGIYHLTAKGETSWCGFARHVLEHAEKAGIPLKVSAAHIGAIMTEAYPLPATRPRNSRLDCNRLESTFGLRLPHWQIGVTRMLNEIIN
jgi:dTDP-4-dehydrorhamnose reductase